MNIKKSYQMAGRLKEIQTTWICKQSGNGSHPEIVNIAHIKPGKINPSHEH